MNLNGYPEKFFDRIVRSFLNKIFEKLSSTSEPIEPKRIVLFTLPFSGLHSVQIRNQRVLNVQRQSDITTIIITQVTS